MATTALRDAASFLRWRLVPVRKLGKIKNRIAGHAAPPAREATFDPGRIEQLKSEGYCPAMPVDPAQVQKMQDIYLPRGEAVKATDHGHPFKNVVRPEDYNADNPLFQLAFSDDILNAAQAYFDGEFSFASIQVARSFPTSGDLRESQKWHLDYGDAKSLHFIMYLNDVTAIEHGPFVFVDKQVSRKVKRSPIIRRLTDDQIAGEIGTDEFEVFYGKAGSAILMDPAACYHFGSRCRVPRTAVFITFNTHVPYTAMMDPLGSHRAQAAREAKRVRPDLAPQFIDSILQV